MFTAGGGIYITKTLRKPFMKKFFHHIFKRKLLPLYFLFPILALMTFFLFFSGKDAKAFDVLTKDIFQNELYGNTLNLHYTLADPESFGIARYEPTLPIYSASLGEASAAALDDYISRLSAIHKNELDDKQQYTYALLERFLSHAKENSAFPYYDEPLSPASGMQSQLPILFAEYAFRSAADVEDYLALLEQTDDYFASLLVYEQEKKAAGLLQADTSLQQVREQCYTILSKDELAQGTHFLQTTFAERLEKLLQEKKITEEDAARYKAQNDRLLSTVMLPAYESLADGLFLLMGDGSSKPTGLCASPLGRDYYLWLVKKNTGSALTIEEIKAVLYPRFEAEYQMLHELLTEREDSVSLWIQILQDNSFPLLAPEDMLADLQKRMSGDFPAFPSGIFGGDNAPSLSVKTVSESLQDYCAPAFYLTPPLDDTENNVIYINEKSTPEGLALYTTLAHEGYPGHLYQSVYSQRALRQEDQSLVRQVLSYGGYLEGWALYVEFISYDYAAALAAEQGDENAAYAYTIEKHNRNMQLCLYALLDVAIHYDGASYEKIHEVLSSFGITDIETTRHIYDYIAEEPSNYLKYYLSYLEILRLKEEARTQWGEAYSDLKFHTFFLNCGPSDFSTISEALKNQQ